jgi:hypothetical protein
MKEGIFRDPQIQELFRDLQFDEILHGYENAVWESVFVRSSYEKTGHKITRSFWVSSCHAV